MVIVGAILKFGGDQATNNITHEIQEQMAKDVSTIKENTDWTKTTLIDHMNEDDKRERARVEAEKDLKQTIIDQNKVLIEALKK